QGIGSPCAERARLSNSTHRGCHAHSSQRLSPAEKAARIEVTNGTISRTKVQIVTPRGNGSVPEERRQATRFEVQARSAPGRDGAAPPAAIGLRAAIARKAEAAAHVWRSGTAIPELLQEGGPA